MDLKNAVALVTGGSSGIGYGIAKALIDSAARVAIAGRSKERLMEAAATLGAHPIQADGSKATSSAPMLKSSASSATSTF